MWRDVTLLVCVMAIMLLLAERQLFALADPMNPGEGHNWDSTASGGTYWMQDLQKRRDFVDVRPYASGAPNARRMNGRSRRRLFREGDFGVHDLTVVRIYALHAPTAGNLVPPIRGDELVYLNDSVTTLGQQIVVWQEPTHEAWATLYPWKFTFVQLCRPVVTKAGNAYSPWPAYDIPMSQGFGVDVAYTPGPPLICLADFGVQSWAEEGPPADPSMGRIMLDMPGFNNPWFEGNGVFKFEATFHTWVLATQVQTSSPPPPTRRLAGLFKWGFLRQFDIPTNAVTPANDRIRVDAFEWKAPFGDEYPIYFEVLQAPNWYRYEGEDISSYLPTLP